LEQELDILNGQAITFEQPITEFKQIKIVRKDLKLLKNVWDYFHIIKSSLDDWKTTLWKKLNIEEIDQECKKFIRELRRMSYSAY
jgi:dynein heavy chain